MAKEPIQVNLPSGVVLTLDTNESPWKWSGEGGGEDAGLYAGLANCVHQDYSPADGEPGYLLAQKVADLMGGEAILPEVTGGDEGDVY